jgi:hypothetical protein
MFTNWNLRIWEYDFLSPAWLWGLILVPFCVFLMIRNEKNKNGELKFARSEGDQRSLSADWISQLRGIIIVLYGVIAVLLIVAMAKPYDWASDENSEEEISNEVESEEAPENNEAEITIEDIKIARVQFNTKCFEIFYSDKTSAFISYLMIINNTKYTPEKLFYVAFCITVHRSQGSTFNHPYTIHQFELFDERLKYVALSRSTDKNLINIF